MSNEEAKQAQIEDLRTQMARRTVERDMAIQMAACCEQAQAFKRLEEINVQLVKTHNELTIDGSRLDEKIAALQKEVHSLEAQQAAVHANKREPLSDGQIDAVTLAQWGEMQGYPLAAHRAYARAIEAKAQQVAVPQGDWLWCKLMDFCKKRGYAPAFFDDLFAIVAEAREAQQVTVPAETKTVWVNAIPPGYVLAPLVPTEAMIVAGRCATCRADEMDIDDDYRAVYQDMLKAAPQPPQGDTT